MWREGPVSTPPRVEFVRPGSLPSKNTHAHVLMLIDNSKMAVDVNVWSVEGRSLLDL